MAEPSTAWGALTELLRPVLTPALVIGAVVAIWKLLFSGRIDDIKAERDRALVDRDKDVQSEERMKEAWKDAIHAKAELEHRLDPSIPPPPPREQQDTLQVIVEEEHQLARQRAREPSLNPLSEREEQERRRQLHGAAGRQDYLDHKKQQHIIDS